MLFDEHRQDCFDALAWVTALMEATAPGQLSEATPCTEYDARTRMGHLIGTAHRGLETAEGVSTHEPPHVVSDVPDAQPATTYAELADRIRAAWAPSRPHDQDGERHGRLGPHPTPARTFARSSTPRSISGVSLPVKVFCWLTW